MFVPLSTASKIQQHEELKERIAWLEKDILDRKRRWTKIRDVLSRKIPVKFKQLLNLNDQSGNINFDHDGKTLQLAVQKGTESNDKATKDVKGLR